MKEFKELIKMCEDINRYGKDVTVETHKTMYKVSGLTRCKAIYDNYKQCCDLLFRELRDVEAAVSFEQYESLDKQRVDEVEELQADYDRALEHCEEDHHE